MGRSAAVLAAPLRVAGGLAAAWVAFGQNGDDSELAGAWRGAASCRAEDDC